MRIPQSSAAAVCRVVCACVLQQCVVQSCVVQCLCWLCASAVAIFIREGGQTWELNHTGHCVNFRGGLPARPPLLE